MVKLICLWLSRADDSPDGTRDHWTPTWYTAGPGALRHVLETGTQIKNTI